MSQLWAYVCVCVISSHSCKWNMFFVTKYSLLSPSQERILPLSKIVRLAWLRENVDKSDTKLLLGHGLFRFFPPEFFKTSFTFFICFCSVTHCGCIKHECIFYAIFPSFRSSVWVLLRWEQLPLTRMRGLCRGHECFIFPPIFFKYLLHLTKWVSSGARSAASPVCW